MVVVETPNRLAYLDAHTSLESFFGLLPDEVAIAAAPSVRREFLASSLQQIPAAAQSEALARWGRGVSFHDFEVTLGESIHAHIVADGYDPRILNLRGPSLSEQILAEYWRRAGVAKPRAWSRPDLDIIFSKTPLPRPPGGVANSVPPPEIGLPLLLSKNQAMQMAAEQLNGSTLARLALRKAWQKASRPFRSLNG
ncbi:MAG: hypothetical protein PSX37_06675 [bacterium]|nr:hypothetical protein [bacterium]